MSSAINAVKDWLSHHPNDHVETVEGIDLLVREVSMDTFGHKIQFTVVGSPDDKLDGVSVICKGSSAKKARAKNIEYLAAKVKEMYKNSDQKAEEKKTKAKEEIQ